MTYPRDLVGYGRNPPNANWPDGARIAVQFVINYEEGGENSILHGDGGSEAFLSEMVGAQSHEGARAMAMESLYEYGSRAGFWRLHRLLRERQADLIGNRLLRCRGPYSRRQTDDERQCADRKSAYRLRSSS